jgi:hypothetical protein
VASALVAGLVLALPAAASAAWSEAMRAPLSVGAMWPATAMNARGDAAVAWIQEGRSHGHATARVRVAVRAAASRRFTVETLVARRDLAARGTAVAVDSRGEVTVAWIEQASDAGRFHGHKTVRSAFRRTDGTWSAIQAVGRSAAFNYASPRLAVTGRGTVVLTYNAFSSGPSGVSAAWRSRGHRFGAVQSVPVGHDHLLDPTLAVDPSGTAYLTGTRGCDRSGGQVLVAIAPSGRRRFTKRVAATTTPGMSVRMAVMGPGSIALSWLSGRCNTTEDLGGLPAATTIRRGVPAPVTALGAETAIGLTVTGVGAGADVSFVTSPSQALMTAHVGADGTVAAPVAPTDGWIALAGDPAGDQLIGRPAPGGAAVTPLAARPVDGGAEPAPVGAIGFPWTAGVAAAPDGRGLAALSFLPRSSMTPSIVIAVWRPPTPVAIGASTASGG